MTSSLRFSGDWPVWLVLAMGLGTALVVVWFYLRETKSMAFPYNNLLPALRGAAVAAVIFVLAGPIWHKRTIIGTLGRIVFAVDTSESMLLTDSSTTDPNQSRIRRAARMLVGTSETSGWLETLAKTHHVDVVAFSSGPPKLVWSSRDAELSSNATTPFAALGKLTADGKLTDLSSGLTYTPGEKQSNAPESVSAEEAALASRSAVVLMSDGRDNLGVSAVEMATRLASRGVAVHAIGFGSDHEPIDAGIVDVEQPESVASDGRLAGSLLVKRSGVQTPIAVRIESGETIVWQSVLPAAVGNPDELPTETRFPFEFDVKPLVEAIQAASSRGVQRGTAVLDLRAVVAAVENDAATENNSMQFRVAATTRSRRLLILDGSSRWEIRYLRNLFERDPTWQVDTVLFGPGTDMPQVIRGDESGELPDSPEVISRYDAIILGEVPTDQFNEIDGLHLREFVSRGGGLIVIDGRLDRIRAMSLGVLSDLIPVRFPSPAQHEEVSFLEPTTIGSSHATMNLVGIPAEEQKLWSSLPAPTDVAVNSAQPDAEVWATARTKENRSVPFLVTRLFGSGRVFYFSSGQTWRWRYKVADRFHSRFWNQLLAAAMQPPYSVSDQYASIGTDRVEYQTGDSAQIRVRLQDAAGKPVGQATVDAILVQDGRPVMTVPLSLEDAARGTYQAYTSPLPSGHYDVRIQASGFDTSVLAASTPIWVGNNNSLEYRRVSLDRATLEEIASASKGDFFHEAEAAGLLEQLTPLSDGSIVETDIIVWQSFYWFWAVIVLLAIEWFLRKRAGLV